MTKHEILNAVNRRLLESTNYLIEERKQHNQNYYESILRHRELLLLYNDIDESNELTTEQIKRYEELMKTINNEKVLDSLNKKDKKELATSINLYKRLNPTNKSKTACRVCCKVEELNE